MDPLINLLLHRDRGECCEWPNPLAPTIVASQHAARMSRLTAAERRAKWDTTQWNPGRRKYPMCGNKPLCRKRVSRLDLIYCRICDPKSLHTRSTA